MQRSLPSPPPTLEYALPPPWHHGRGARRAMIGVTLLLAALIAWRFAPMAWRQAQLLYWQNKCMNYTAPVDKVVFSSDGSIANVPNAWRQFYGLLSPPGNQSNGTVFLHERISPGGSRRLVAVDVNTSGPPGSSQWIFLFERNIMPASALKPARELTSGMSSVNGRFGELEGLYYSGQPDESDPSHFTLRIVSDRREMIIDGWLTNDDLVLLEPRAIQPPASTQPVP